MEMNPVSSVILIGAESSICCDFLETMARANINVAASIVTGPAEWDMDGIGPAYQWDDLPAELCSVPFAVPWVASGWRRERVDAALSKGLSPVGLLSDPTAILPRVLTVGAGVYINAGAVIGAQTVLGDHVFVNRNASLGHHNVIEDYVTVGPGASIAGRVRIGRGTFIGAGAAIASGVTIGANTIIASGASIYRDVPSNVLAAGNPFRIVKTGIAGYQGVGV
jgi:sugar O-acyltransferase (sialic acid O-acetyltransferase NeuD family)